MSNTDKQSAVEFLLSQPNGQAHVWQHIESGLLMVSRESVLPNCDYADDYEPAGTVVQYLDALMESLDPIADKGLIRRIEVYERRARRASDPSVHIPVIEIGECPADSTYFRVADVEPRLSTTQGNIDNLHPADARAVTIWIGRGTHRSSWGSPQVNSTILINDKTLNLLAIHIGFSHKHGGGQFYRYYDKNSDGAVCETTWAKLTNEQRQAVLDAPKPSWAKTPGKLRQPKAKQA